MGEIEVKTCTQTQNYNLLQQNYYNMLLRDSWSPSLGLGYRSKLVARQEAISGGMVGMVRKDGRGKTTTAEEMNHRL